MYIFLKYIDYDDFKFSDTETIVHQVTPSTSMMNPGGALDKQQKSGMFFENTEIMINPDCYIGTILDYVIQMVKIPKYVTFDMCTENGVLLNVKSYSPDTSGLSIFKLRETYYVAVYEKDDMVAKNFVIPVVHKNSKQYVPLTNKLKKYELPIKKLGPKASTTSLASKSSKMTHKSIKPYKKRDRGM